MGVTVQNATDVLLNSNNLPGGFTETKVIGQIFACLLYTSDAADERSSVDLGGRRIIKKKKTKKNNKKHK